jgi:hypothetical protein
MLVITLAFAEENEFAGYPRYASAQRLTRLRAGSAESAETAQVVADFNALDIFAPICDNGGNAESSPDCRKDLP